MGSTGPQKDINELKRLVVANGFKLVPNGAGHMKLLDKKGRVVTDANGPVIISGSASDVRARDMHVKRLMACGALTADPWKPTAKKSDDQREEEQTKRGFKKEDIEKAHRVQAELSQERAKKTAALRGRIEPFVVAIGGWEKRGLAAELSGAAFHFLKSRGRVECWKTVDGATQNARQLKLGNTLSEQAMAAWNLFMDEIERSGDTIDARRTRYMELVRESKGIGTTQPAPEPGPPAEIRVLPAPVVEESTVSTVAALAQFANNGYKTPTLALRALAEMMYGRVNAEGGALSAKEALEIAEEILDMEIRTITGQYVGVQVNA